MGQCRTMSDVYIMKKYCSVRTCAQPSISDGSVIPSDATVNYEATYQVTCNVGFTIYGSSTMTCGASGGFDQTPMCQGKMQKRKCK